MKVGVGGGGGGGVNVAVGGSLVAVGMTGVADALGEAGGSKVGLARGEGIGLAGTGNAVRVGVGGRVVDVGLGVCQATLVGTRRWPKES